MMPSPIALLPLLTLLPTPAQDALEVPHPEAAYGVSEEAGFGHALVQLDFDGDGCLDLAVGAPGEARVHLFRSTLLSGGGFEPFLSIDGHADFGHALAAGDFDGDGVLELAVGAPGGPRQGSGAGVVIVDLDVPSLPRLLPLDVVDTDLDRHGSFGHALAALDMDADGIDDLAVGAPEAAHACSLVDPNAGLVLFVSPRNGTSRAVWNPLLAGEGRFGEALETADLDGDGRDELVAWAPGNAPARGSARFRSVETDAPAPPTGMLHVYMAPTLDATRGLSSRGLFAPAPEPGSARRASADRHARSPRVAGARTLEPLTTRGTAIDAFADSLRDAGRPIVFTDRDGDGLADLVHFDTVFLAPRWRGVSVATLPALEAPWPSADEASATRARRTGGTPVQARFRRGRADASRDELQESPHAFHTDVATGFDERRFRVFRDANALWLQPAQVAKDPAGERDSGDRSGRAAPRSPRRR